MTIETRFGRRPGESEVAAVASFFVLLTALYTLFLFIVTLEARTFPRF